MKVQVINNLYVKGINFIMKYEFPCKKKFDENNNNNKYPSLKNLNV
jgi:hypothetical protein